MRIFIQSADHFHAALYLPKFRTNSLIYFIMSLPFFCPCVMEGLHEVIWSMQHSDEASIVCCFILILAAYSDYLTPVF